MKLSTVFLVLFYLAACLHPHAQTITGTGTFTGQTQLGPVDGPPFYPRGLFNSAAVGPPFLLGGMTMPPTMGFGNGNNCGGVACAGGLYGRGLVISDPNYNGVKLYRITDGALTFDGVANQSTSGHIYSYAGGCSAPEVNWWNSTNTLIQSCSTNGFVHVFQFNETTWKSAACAPNSTTCTAMTYLGFTSVLNGTDFFGFTQADANAAYGISSTTPGKLVRKIITTGPFAVTVDPDWPVTAQGGVDFSAYLPFAQYGNDWGVTVANFGISLDDKFLCMEYRMNGQDRQGMALCYDKDLNQATYFDTLRGKICPWQNNTASCTEQDMDQADTTNYFIKAAAPAAPTLGQTTGGPLTLLHQYTVCISYTLSRGETACSATSQFTLTGSNNAITITAPGRISGQRLNEDTGYTAYLCDNTASPGYTPVLADAGGVAAPTLNCSVNGGNTGTTYTWDYYIQVTSAGGLSSTAHCTLQTAAKPTSLANTIGVTCPAGSTFATWRMGSNFSFTRDWQIDTARACTGANVNLTDNYLFAQPRPKTTINSATAGLTLGAPGTSGLTGYTASTSTSGAALHAVFMAGANTHCVWPNFANAKPSDLSSWCPYSTQPGGGLRTLICVAGANCQGHKTQLANVMFNNPDNSSCVDAYTHTVSGTSMVETKVVKDNLSGSCFDASYSSSSNISSGGTYVLQNIYSSADPTYYYTDEILLHTLDVNKRVIREANTYGRSQGGGVFWGWPRAVISQNGKYAIFNTRWDMFGNAAYGFGAGDSTDATTQACDRTLEANAGNHGCRADLFLLQLQ